MMIRFAEGIKHSEELGLELVDITENGLIIKLPYSEKIIGNPETGVIHGGAITSLMDQTCGMAAIRSIVPEFDIAPTIDLRIDYMRAAEPGRDVFALAETFRATKNVLFTRGIAYQDSPEKPIANGVATFMRMGLGKTIVGKDGQKKTTVKHVGKDSASTGEG
ncbi:MAG: PaaI family thioesterase [Pseudomonadales bacterium]|nr:PaaI family thioesterase [Pseudomonadales bacterium]